MDKTPCSSSMRRSQKRPHSPQDDRTNPAVETKIPSTESNNILESGKKRDKLLRLLGGKKRKNETAASKWLERVRSREDELKLSTELECQFNESLTHKLTGQVRRHTGIGFAEELHSSTSARVDSVDMLSNNNIKSSTDNKDAKLKQDNGINPSVRSDAKKVNIVDGKLDSMKCVYLQNTKTTDNELSKKETVQLGHNKFKHQEMADLKPRSKTSFYAQFKKAA